MIEQVLDHYGAQVMRTGRIKCPFHDDTHASGSVDIDRGLFYCHVCGVGGDAIAIIRWRENLDYADAVKFAERITGESHDTLRGTTPEQSGYGLPRKQRTRQRRKYVPSWLRG